MNKANHALFALLCTVAFGLSACAKTDATSTPTELEGTWVYSDCATNKKRDTYAFTGSSFTITQENFTDTACATSMVKVVITGTFTIGEAVTTPANSKKINFTVSAMDATPGTGAAATFNANPPQCQGFTGFVDNTATSILGKNCSGSPYSGAAEPAAGDTNYDIFSIATDGKSFQLGATTNDNDLPGASTAAAVPTSLDSTTYTKQ